MTQLPTAGFEDGDHQLSNVGDLRNWKQEGKDSPLDPLQRDSPACRQLVFSPGRPLSETVRTYPTVR